MHRNDLSGPAEIAAGSDRLPVIMMARPDEQDGTTHPGRRQAPGLPATSATKNFIATSTMSTVCPSLDSGMFSTS